MDQKKQDFLHELMNNPRKRAELLMPGYSKDLEKIIDQVIASAKTKFNYQVLLSSFSQCTEENAEIFADYLLRAIVVEFGMALDKESGMENCINQLRSNNHPFSRENTIEVANLLYPVLKKEFGAIQKLNYLSRELTPIDEMIEKIRKEVEIKTDELGFL